MPSYRVTIEGHVYEVEVLDPSARPVRAIVNGGELHTPEVFEVEIQEDVTPSTRAAVPRPAGEVANAPISTAKAPEARAEVVSRQEAKPAAPTDGGNEVVAPLPGTIVSIGVAQGDTVEHGQELCILEAMKMNNPIRATQGGVVKKICVAVGERVQHGTPLMVIASE